MVPKSYLCATADEDDLLASCYRRSLEVGDRLDVKSIAFPAISTGIFGFPKQRAAQIAVTEIRGYTDLYWLEFRSPSGVSGVTT